MLTSRSLDLEEEAPEVHQALQALTREGEPGVTLICLHRLPDGDLVFDPQHPLQKVQLDRVPDRDATRMLMGCSVRVQDPALVAYFYSRGAHSPWIKSATLRHGYPVVFEGGVCRLEGSTITLHLDREMGLQVQRKQEVQ